jgi:hypothetical protein
MLFIVRGHLQSSQVPRNRATSCCTLGPGNFSGDELLSWCLRRPFLERLPASSSTLVTLESTEAFGLEAGDVRYVTQHFDPLQLHQREGAAQRALLLARLAHLDSRVGAARVAAVQAPQDAHLAVVHPAAQAAVLVFVARGGEAAWQRGPIRLAWKRRGPMCPRRSGQDDAS